MLEPGKAIKQLVYCLTVLFVYSLHQYNVTLNPSKCTDLFHFDKIINSSRRNDILNFLKVHNTVPKYNLFIENLLCSIKNKILKTVQFFFFSFSLFSVF